MTTRIGLLGDPHATVAPLAEALERLAKECVDEVWCVGDIAGYGDELESTVELLRRSGVKAVLGNHDLWQLGRIGEISAACERFLRQLPLVHQATIEGVSLYMVHASPPDLISGGIRLLDEEGAIIPQQRQAWTEQLAPFKYDVLLVGHTHQLFCEQLGDTLVVNPGSTRFNHCCAILTLPQCEVAILPLSGRAPLRSWNWGRELRGEE